MPDGCPPLLRLPSLNHVRTPDAAKFDAEGIADAFRQASADFRIAFAALARHLPVQSDEAPGGTWSQLMADIATLTGEHE